jgi:ABC-2 type transport system ATP-binding protein
VLSVETSSVGDVLQRLGGHGIEALTCQPPTLEELFLSQYREALTPDSGTDVTPGSNPREEVPA